MSSPKLIWRKIHSPVILALITKKNNKHIYHLLCTMHQCKYFTDKIPIRKGDCTCLLA